MSYDRNRCKLRTSGVCDAEAFFVCEEATGEVSFKTCSYCMSGSLALAASPLPRPPGGLLTSPLIFGGPNPTFA
eukprot:6172449-Pleurochrysis_carterae.AAC.2